MLQNSEKMTSFIKKQEENMKLNISSMFFTSKSRRYTIKPCFRAFKLLVETNKHHFWDIPKIGLFNTKIVKY